MNNFSKLYLYYGVHALGWKIGPFKDTYMGCGPIGYHTLQMLEEQPLIHKVRPILKPFNVAIRLIHKHEWHHDAYQICRELGYDMDNLLKQDLAVIHSNYKFML